MEKDIILLKLTNSTAKCDTLNIEDVSSIVPVVDKDGNPCLSITCYDDEFCLNCSLFCDKIDVIVIN